MTVQSEFEYANISYSNLAHIWPNHLRLMQIQQFQKKSPALGKYELVVYVILIETSY